VGRRDNPGTSLPLPRNLQLASFSVGTESGIQGKISFKGRETVKREGGGSGKRREGDEEEKEAEGLAGRK